MSVNEILENIKNIIVEKVNEQQEIIKSAVQDIDALKSNIKVANGKIISLSIDCNKIANFFRNTSEVCSILSDYNNELENVLDDVEINDIHNFEDVEENDLEDDEEDDEEEDDDEEYEPYEEDDDDDDDIPYYEPYMDEDYED